MTSEVGPVYFLLVDDLEENLLSLEGLLRRDGLVLLKARSGTQALELLLQHDFALAILDVQMPEMDGYQLAELMRGTERTHEDQDDCEREPKIQPYRLAYNLRREAVAGVAE